MKMTIEVDCTPEEARAFMGLPDVRPMQAAMMANMEEQATRAAESMTPEALLKQWFTALPALSSQLQEMFGRMISNSTGKH